MKKPSPAKQAARERKRDVKRKTTAEWMAASQFMTIAITLSSVLIGFVLGWAGHVYLQ